MLDELRDHRPADDDEAAHLAYVRAFVARHADPFDRRIAEGHLTGSAYVFSADGARLLLVHHRKLDRWLQPGGHADPGERDGLTVALREAREETHLDGLAPHPRFPGVLDLDVHGVPARGTEPAHLHLDLRYALVAPDGALAKHDPAESHALRWFAWDELDSVSPDAGMRRVLRKIKR